MNFSAEKMDRQAAISLQKENGTFVDYYLTEQFEIHKNKIPAATQQDWHAHCYLQEIIFVLAGALQVEILQKDGSQTMQLAAEELLAMNNSLHRVSNPTNAACEFIVFRFIPHQKLLLKK